MSEQLKTVTRRITEELFNQGRLEVADEVFKPDYVDHAAPPGVPAGTEGLKAFVQSLRQAFPDLHYEILREVVEGDVIVGLTRVSGTMQGDFMGMPATGKRAEWDEMHMVRAEGDKLVEHWAVIDRLGMLEQLGLVPAAGASAP
jgi:predicted ester cyclase